MTTATIPPLIGFGALAQRLGLIVGGLRVVLAALGGRDRAVVPIVVLAWTRVGRLAARFEALVARLQAGRPPRRPAPPRERTGAARPPPSDGDSASGAVRLPRGFGWLIRLLKWEAVAYGSQLQALLAEPGMAELLKADPRAGSILRPLCHMLAIKPEGGLALPPFPRKRVPRKAAPETAGAETPGPKPPRPRPTKPKPNGEPPSAISQVWAALIRQTAGGITPVATPEPRARKPPW